MSQLLLQGSFNPTALIVPGLYVQLVPPQLLLLNGVPTNVLGVVGTATWGPVGSPVTVARMTDYAANFGQLLARKYDMGTGVALAIQQGAQNFRCVRVTDGTDTAATLTENGTALDAIKSVTVAGTAHVGDILTLTITPNGGSAIPLVFTSPATPTVQADALALQALVNGNATLQAAGITADTPITGVFNIHYPAASVATVAAAVTGGGATTTMVAGSASTLSTPQRTYTSLWTGTLGNSISVVESAGTAASTTKVTITIPGRVPEIFDNIAGTGAVLNRAIANAINLGQSGIRGPSQIVSCAAGFGTAGVTLPATLALAGGTDGATTITGATLIGVDTLPRTGMYALRSQGCAVAFLADCDDLTTWAAQVTFGLSEAIYMMLVGPAGETIVSAAANRATAGIDTFIAKQLLGDWCYWPDPVTGQTRLVSPQGIAAGLYANMTPEKSGLNKQVFGIIGTQKTQSGLAYANADLQTLVQNGIDVISNPSPGGAYFALQIGHNCSSNPVVQQDAYSRMSLYIAATLNAGMGKFIGLPATSTVLRNAKATLDAFFNNLFVNGQIGTADGTTIPWQATVTKGSLGFVQANVQVTYLDTIEKLLVSLEGGQTVTIQKLSTQPNN